MTPDEMVDVTYEAGLTVNRIKAEAGIVDAATAAATERRIAEAREAMRRIDAIMEGPASGQNSALGALKEEFDRLSESTVCEKSELNWPASAGISHVAAAAGLFVRENAANLLGRGRFRPAASDQHAMPVTHAACDRPEA
jgi:hypothetical protein